jgi:hypothetical protein
MVKLGSELSLNAIKFGSTSTYLVASGNDLLGYVGGARAITFSSSGSEGAGTLHGTWVADNQVTYSDRRIKTNIKPLLGGRFNTDEPASSMVVSEKSAPRQETPSNLHWMLRQLRPVSYQFRRGTDSKNVRFGFIADEMERVLPEVVRSIAKAPELDSPTNTSEADSHPKNTTADNETTRDDGAVGGDMKGIVYTDLIAVLTSVVKDFGSTLQNMQERMRISEIELDRLDREQPMDPIQT